MKIKSLNYKVVFLTITTLFLGFHVHPCSCGVSISNEINEEHLDTKNYLIFTGEVISINNFSWVSEQDSLQEFESISGVKVTLKLMHSYNNSILTDTLSIFTGVNPVLDCGFSFEKKTSYLVVLGAQKNRAGLYSTSVCVPTKKLSLANQDIEFLQDNSDVKDPILQKIEFDSNLFNFDTDSPSKNIFGKSMRK